MIRAVTQTDASQICEIYNHYVLYTTVTFEESPVLAEDMIDRIRSTSSKLPWVVFEIENKILGYAYATEWRSRSAYRHSVESTVYLNDRENGKGIGSQLYHELINQLKTMDIHAVIGGISLPNDNSIALHEKFGFKKVAHFKEVGYKFGKWIDVGYWELILDPK